MESAQSAAAAHSISFLLGRHLPMREGSTSARITFRERERERRLDPPCQFYFCTLGASIYGRGAMAAPQSADRVVQLERRGAPVPCGARQG